MPRPKAAHVSAPPINLDTKLRPTQARAQDTYEVVLATAGEMLRTMGFEQLTTNAICKKAGLTPPALYRYFPNKYAILKALGERLMAEQDQVVLAWIEDGGLDGSGVDDWLAKSVAIQRQMVDIILNFPGGAAIGRALRAVPMLQSLRFESRDMVADRFFQAICVRYPDTPEHRLRVATRMMVELSYAASEMVVEEPERDADYLNYEVCLLFALYFESFKSPPPEPSPYAGAGLQKQ